MLMRASERIGSSTSRHASAGTGVCNAALCARLYSHANLTGTSCFSRPRRRCSCWYVPTFASHPRDAAASSLASQCHHHLLLSLLHHHRHRTSHNVNAQSSAACARGLVTLKRLWLPLNSRQSRHSHSFLCVVLTRVESQVRTLTFAQEVCARCGNDLNAVLSLRYLHFGARDACSLVLLLRAVTHACDM